MDLSGKVAIVTGGGRGIGRGASIGLAEAGADLSVCDVNDEDIEETCEGIQKKGHKAIGLRADVTSPEEIRQMVKGTIMKFGKIDILVNNAGILKSTPALEISEREWDQILDVNLKGVFLCTKAVLGGMIERRYGKIISLSSIDYLRGSTPPHLHYGTSKAGVTGFTKTLAREVGKYGINVNAVAPGVIETEMTTELIRLHSEKYLKDICMERIGKPEDVAGAIVFLASDYANYITGQTLNVNGGMLGGMV